MNKVYFRINGGLGDCLNKILAGAPTYALGIKAINPNAVIYAVCGSSNASVLEAFEHHPGFDKALLAGSHEHEVREVIASIEAEGFQPWWKVYDPKSLKHQFHRVYLTDEETTVVDMIVSRGPYVAVHPFNSAGTGITAQHFEVPTDYRRIINQVIDAGYRLVQLGHNWTHNPSGSLQIEDFAYDHPKFINMVNLLNLRQTIKVIQNAEKFIGTSSFGIVVAAVSGVPSFMILPHHMNDILLDEQKTGQGLRGELIHHHGISSGAAVPELYDLTEYFLQTPMPGRAPGFRGNWFQLS